jgi:Cytochrome c/c1 heme lyase
MASVLALHNNRNEKTWAKVVEWEHQTYSNTAQPKQLKCMGRPHDLSPKATFKHFVLGHPLSYDRHDWTFLREDATTVRYVIDYYYDDSRAQ